jgi:hypothetical protein
MEFGLIVSPMDGIVGSVDRNAALKLAGIALS